MRMRDGRAAGESAFCESGHNTKPPKASAAPWLLLVNFVRGKLAPSAMGSNAMPIFVMGLFSDSLQRGSDATKPCGLITHSVQGLEELIQMLGAVYQLCGKKRWTCASHQPDGKAGRVAAHETFREEILALFHFHEPHLYQVATQP